MRNVVIALAALACLMAVCDAHKTQAPLDKNGVPIVRCATEEMFHKRYPLYDARHMAEGRLADCPTKGDCDNATIRDLIDTNNLITINTVIHVLRDNQGNMPDGTLLPGKRKLFVSQLTPCRYH